MAVTTPTIFQPGFRLLDGTDLNAALANELLSSEDAITATAAGTQATARQLAALINRISVCVTAADAVKLPVSKSGLIIWVINDGAASAQIFGQVGDTIDGIATATGVAMAAAKRGAFFCETPGAWQSFAGAKSS